jgi:hypothetical protein
MLFLDEIRPDRSDFAALGPEPLPGVGPADPQTGGGHERDEQDWSEWFQPHG